MSTNTVPAATPLSDAFGDRLLDAAIALASAHEAGEVSADEAVATFLGLSAAGVAWFGDGRYCDGCDLVLSAEVCDVVGLVGASATDSNGDLDVVICAFCAEESRNFYTPDENGWTP